MSAKYCQRNFGVVMARTRLQAAVAVARNPIIASCVSSIARRTYYSRTWTARPSWHLVRRLPRPAPQPQGGWEPVSRDRAMRSVSRARAILQCTEKLSKVMPDLRYDLKDGRCLPRTLATVAATRAPRSSRGWQTACRDHEPEGARGSARARAGAGRARRGRNAWGMP